MNAVVPISIFGPISKFVLLKRTQCLIEKHETFQKRSMRNRFYIYGANGQQCLSIPLSKGKNKTYITETSISYEENWIRDHLQSIRSAYGNAPYFDYYFDKISQIFNMKFNKLIDLFEACYSFLSSSLNLSEINYTESFILNYDNYIDFRNKVDHDKVKIKAYFQVFEDKHGFISNLSILDLLFNLGPESVTILNDSSIKNSF